MFMMIGLLCMGGVALALATPTEQIVDDDDATMSPDGVDDTGEEASTAEDGEVSTDEGSLLDYAAEALQDTPEPEADDIVLPGTDGDDTLEGGVDDEFLVGDAGKDELLGGAGADVLLGGAGDDIAVSDEGDDTLYGGADDDALHGRAGNDLMNGGLGQDSLFGGDGDDTLVGRDEAEDYLIGADGDDVLIAGQGDHAYGGEGKDTFVLFAPGNADGGGADLADFNPDDDVVVVLVSPDQADAEVTLGSSESDPDQTELRIDGEVVATMATADAPNPEDIQLLISSAEAIAAMR